MLLVSAVRLSFLLSAAAQLSVSIDRETGAYAVVVGGARLSAPNATGLRVGGVAMRDAAGSPHTGSPDVGWGGQDPSESQHGRRQHVPPKFFCFIYRYTTARRTQQVSPRREPRFR